MREERAERVSFSLPGASVATSGVREGRQVELARVGHGIRREVPWFGLGNPLIESLIGFLGVVLALRSARRSFGS